MSKSFGLSATNDERSSPLCTPLRQWNQNQWHNKQPKEEHKRMRVEFYYHKTHLRSTMQAVGLVTDRFFTITLLWAVSLINTINECKKKTQQQQQKNTTHATSPCMNFCNLLFCSLTKLRAARTRYLLDRCRSTQSPVTVSGIFCSMLKEEV